MAFLHKETTGTIQVLTQSGNKSSYVAGSSITWHLKPYSLEDTTFNISNIEGEIYKMTIKADVTISQADKLVIGSDTYVVKDVKKYSGINFTTTKILLVK